MSTETQMEKFEEWASLDTRIANIDRYEKTDLDDEGPYKNWDTAFAWSVWQVALASQAAEIEALRKDVKRLDWLQQKIFVSKWNGVIDSGSRTSWHIAGDYRHTTVTMNGATFREAIDAAMQTKEAS